MDKTKRELLDEIFVLKKQIADIEMSQLKNLSSEEEFRTSEERFRFLAENSKDMIYRMSLPNGNYEYVSPASTEIFGYSPDDFVNKPLLIKDAIHPDWIEYFTEQWDNIFKDKMPPVYEYQIIHGITGQTRWINQRNVLIRGQKKKLLAIEGIVTDITEQKKAENKIKDQAIKWQTTFDAMSDSVSIIDLNGRINQYNAATLSLLNIADEDIKEKRCYELIHGTKEPFPDCPLLRMKNTKKFESMIFKKKDRWLEVSVDPIFDANKILMGAVHVVSDITKRKQTEELLKKQNSRYYTLLQNLDGLVYRCKNDKDWTMNFVSEGCFKLTGYKSEELIGNAEISFNNLILPEYQKFVWESWQTKLQNHESIEIEYRIKTASGKIKWVLERACGIYNKKGEVTHLEGFITDITERKKAENELYENERILNEVGNIAKIGGWEMDLKKDGKATWTKGTYDIVEIKQGDPIPGAEEHLDFYLPEFREMIKIKMQDLIETKQSMSFEAQLRTKNGNLKWCQAIGEAIEEDGELVKLRGTFQDITERKNAEIELRKSKETLTQIVYGSSIATIVIDNKHRVTHWNKACEELTGVKAKNMLGNKNLWKAFYLTKRFIMAEMILDGYSDKEIKSYYKKTFKKSSLIKGAYEAEGFFPKMGKEGKWVYFTAAPIKDQNGEIIGAIETLQDITKRKIAQKELIRLADRLKILHEMDKSILKAKSSKSIASVALIEIAKLISYKLAVVVEYNFDENIISELAAQPIELNKDNSDRLLPIFDNIREVSDSLQEGKVHVIEKLKSKPKKSDVLKKMISQGINSCIIVPLLAEGKLIGALNLAGESMDVFTPDKIEIASEIANQLAVSISQWKLREEIITYTEELEEKVIERTAQLEHSNNELREFAQIVSHDLKAPLRAISQLSYWVSQDYSDKIDEEGQQKLQMLMNRVKRLDNLIEGILQYSRAGKQREKETPIDLHHLVEQTISLLDPPSNIKIIIENQLPEYIGDPTRLGQLFQNLINNAIKFMDKPKGLIKIKCERKDEFWQFSISDNGPGIDKKYFDRIFTIFQRLVSRDEKEGTGIGLSLAKRIVQIYGGEIWLESELGLGTTFYFTLPYKTI